MTAFKRSQVKYVKARFKTTNWPQHEAGLRQRGGLTVWISEDELKGWGPPKRGRRKLGGRIQYSNHAIEVALTVGMVFYLRLRQTEGFLRSLFSLPVLDGRVPDHTTISRRGSHLERLEFQPMELPSDGAGCRLGRAVFKPVDLLPCRSEHSSRLEPTR